MTQEPIRVAQIIGPINRNGVESVIFNYYRVFDKTKVQFDFIIDDDSPLEVPNDILALGCRVYKVPPYEKQPANIKALNEIFKREKYKIVHSNMNAMSVFTLYAAKKACVPVRIAHSHSTAGKGEYKKNLIKNLLRPFSKVYPTHLFACSELAGRWLFGDKVFNEGKVIVIRNAIDVEKFRFNQEVRERIRTELGLEGKFVIGHVGRFMTQKNHTFLLDIFAEVLKLKKNSELIMVGDGELKREAEEKAEKLGISESVQFLGLREDVSDLYQAMDEFVLPSLYEGLPVVGVEAQCAGLPCVLSNDITKETILSKITKTLSLSLGAAKWAEEIVGCIEINTDRLSFSKSVCKKWDVRKESDRMLSAYLDIAQVIFDEPTIR